MLVTSDPSLSGLNWGICWFLQPWLVWLFPCSYFKLLKFLGHFSPVASPEAAQDGLRRCSRFNARYFALPISKQNAGGRTEWSQLLLRAGKHSEFYKQRKEDLSWFHSRIKLESTEEEAAEVGSSHLQKPPSRLQHESLDLLRIVWGSGNCPCFRHLIFLSISC